MKMKEMYIKCLDKCQVHRMCLIIGIFIPKGLKCVYVCVCACVHVHALPVCVHEHV